MKNVEKGKLLKAGREELGLSQAEMAEALDLDRTYLSQLENGRREVDDYYVERVNILLKAKKAGVYPGTPGAALMLREEVRKADKPPLMRAIPVVSWARAGAAEFNYHDLAEFIDETVQTDCRDPNAFALIVEGDSMEPKFTAGDRVIVAPNVAARNGNVVIARLHEEGSVLFKLFHQTGPKGETIRLTSYNPVYPPLEVHLGKFRFIYPVYGMYRKTL